MADDSLSNVPPQGASQRQTIIIASLYEAALEDINRQLGRAIGELAQGPTNRGPEFRRSRAARLNQIVRERLIALGRAARPQLDAAFIEAARLGIKDAEDQLVEVAVDLRERTGSQATPGLDFTGVSSQAIEAIAQDTASLTSSDAAGRMLSGARDHADRALGLFRRMSESPISAGPAGSAEASVNQAIARGLITGNVRTAEGAIRELFRGDDEAAESYRKLGNKIIDVGRTQMSVRSYSEMVVRTRTREATVAGRHTRLQRSGLQLVQINGRVSENFCTAFIGLVCGLNGEVTIDGRTYPALSSLPQGGPPFHPNCSKGTSAYLPGVSSPERAEAHRRAQVRFESRRASGRLLAPVRA